MKNNNHASKALAVVLSGALAFAPAANAALDDSNMAYTSAAEGFYGSLRVQYANTESDGEKNDSSVDADLSRLGVRGDIDLGGGLGAFYGFEWNLGNPANGDQPKDGSGLSTRQNHVGLKGDWGSIWLGAFDSVIVRFGGFATTDILDQYSGNFEPIYRTGNAIAYVSPDLNGFNFGIEVAAQDGTKAIGGDADDGNDFDKIGVGASYSIQGLTFSGAYYQEQDALVLGTHALGFTGTNTISSENVRILEGIEELLSSSSDNITDGDENNNFVPVKADDKGQYALGISYNQDNWIVAAMYGGEDAVVAQCVNAETNANNTCESFASRTGDATFFSLAAGVSIDKLDIHGLWEQKTLENWVQADLDLQSTGGIRGYDQDTTIAAITARYHLGSKASLRAAWKNTEVDDNGYSDKTDDTQYALGMRVDF